MPTPMTAAVFAQMDRERKRLAQMREQMTQQYLPSPTPPPNQPLPSPPEGLAPVPQPTQPMRNVVGERLPKPPVDPTSLPIPMQRLGAKQQLGDRLPQPQGQLGNPMSYGNPQAKQGSENLVLDAILGNRENAPYARLAVPPLAAGAAGTLTGGTGSYPAYLAAQSGIGLLSGALGEGLAQTMEGEYDLTQGIGRSVPYAMPILQGKTPGRAFAGNALAGWASGEAGRKIEGREGSLLEKTLDTMIPGTLGGITNVAPKGSRAAQHVARRDKAITDPFEKLIESADLDSTSFYMGLPVPFQPEFKGRLQGKAPFDTSELENVKEGLRTNFAPRISDSEKIDAIVDAAAKSEWGRMAELFGLEGFEAKQAEEMTLNFIAEMHEKRLKSGQWPETKVDQETEEIVSGLDKFEKEVLDLEGEAKKRLEKGIEGDLDYLMDKFDDLDAPAPNYNLDNFAPQRPRSYGEEALREVDAEEAARRAGPDPFEALDDTLDEVDFENWIERQEALKERVRARNNPKQTKMLENAKQKAEAAKRLGQRDEQARWERTAQEIQEDLEAARNEPRKPRSPAPTPMKKPKPKTPSSTEGLPGQQSPWRGPKGGRPPNEQLRAQQMAKGGTIPDADDLAVPTPPAQTTVPPPPRQPPAMPFLLARAKAKQTPPSAPQPTPAAPKAKRKKAPRKRKASMTKNPGTPTPSGPPPQAPPTPTPPTPPTPTPTPPRIPPRPTYDPASDLADTPNETRRMINANPYQKLRHGVRGKASTRIAELLQRAERRWRQRSAMRKKRSKLRELHNDMIDDEVALNQLEATTSSVGGGTQLRRARVSLFAEAVEGRHQFSRRNARRAVKTYQKEFQENGALFARERIFRQNARGDLEPIKRNPAVNLFVRNMPAELGEDLRYAGEQSDLFDDFVAAIVEVNQAQGKNVTPQLAKKTLLSLIENLERPAPIEFQRTVPFWPAEFKHDGQWIAAMDYSPVPKYAGSEGAISSLIETGERRAAFLGAFGPETFNDAQLEKLWEKLNRGEIPGYGPADMPVPKLEVLSNAARAEDARRAYDAIQVAITKFQGMTFARKHDPNRITDRLYHWAISSKRGAQVFRSLDFIGKNLLTSTMFLKQPLQPFLSAARYTGIPNILRGYYKGIKDYKGGQKEMNELLNRTNVGQDRLPEVYRKGAELEGMIKRFMEKASRRLGYGKLNKLFVELNNIVQMHAAQHKFTQIIERIERGGSLTAMEREQMKFMTISDQDIDALANHGRNPLKRAQLDRLADWFATRAMGHTQFAEQTSGFKTAFESDHLLGKALPFKQYFIQTGLRNFEYWYLFKEGKISKKQFAWEALAKWLPSFFLVGAGLDLVNHVANNREFDNERTWAQYVWDTMSEAALFGPFHSAADTVTGKFVSQAWEPAGKRFATGVGAAVAPQFTNPIFSVMEAIRKKDPEKLLDIAPAMKKLFKLPGPAQPPYRKKTGAAKKPPSWEIPEIRESGDGFDEMRRIERMGRM